MRFWKIELLDNPYEILALLKLLHELPINCLKIGGLITA